MSSQARRVPAGGAGSSFVRSAFDSAAKPGGLAVALEAEAHDQLAEDADRRVLDLDVLRGGRRELRHVRGDAALGAGELGGEAVVDVAGEHDDRVVCREPGEQVLVVGAHRRPRLEVGEGAASPAA